ncbi:MAG: ATPase family protein [Candidatus Dependentiae bacterium]|nr:ATPase family protein [Candidatus Dependentiae bacterium]
MFWGKAETFSPNYSSFVIVSAIIVKCMLRFLPSKLFFQPLFGGCMLRDKIFIMLAAVFVSGFVVNECSAMDRDVYGAQQAYIAASQLANAEVQNLRASAVQARADLDAAVANGRARLDQLKRDAEAAAQRAAADGVDALKGQVQQQIRAEQQRVTQAIQECERKKQELAADYEEKKRGLTREVEQKRREFEEANRRFVEQHKQTTEADRRKAEEMQRAKIAADEKLQQDQQAFLRAEADAGPGRLKALEKTKLEAEQAKHLQKVQFDRDNAENTAMQALRIEALKGSALRKGTPTAAELEAAPYSDEDGYDYDAIIAKIRAGGTDEDALRADKMLERRQIQQSMADYELFKRSAEISAEAKMLEDKEIQAYEAALLPKRIAAQAAKDIQEQKVAEVSARETALMNNKFKPLEYRNNKEMLKMKMEGLMNLAKMVGDGFTPKNVALAAAGIGGTYGLVKLLGVGSRQLERILKQPVLVRHSSQGGPLTKLFRSIFPKKSDHATYHLSDMILNPDLAKKLERISNMIKLAQQHGAPLPGVVAYGLPGNGKTMFMEALANDSGMNFAMMTGGDVSALLSSGGKNAAVTEIHKLFDWAITAGPTLLFIDEADAFLKKGRDAKLSEGLAAAINAFLNRTGASSNKVMIVLATNHPHVFDEAVASRMSIWVNFPAPGFNERAKMYVKFLDDVVNEGVGDDHTPVVIVPEARSENFVQEVAKRTDGYSGRDMTRKIFDSLQREMLAEGKFQVDRSLIMQTLNEIDAQEKELNSFNTVGNNGSSFVNHAAAIAA